MAEIPKYRIPTKSVRGYILGGNATFVLLNTGTGNKLRYRVRNIKEVYPKAESKDIFFVDTYVKRTWVRVGSILSRKVFRLASASKFSVHATEFNTFKWFWSMLFWKTVPPALELWHEGRCGKCGQPLHDPKSIERGFGPSCYKKAQAA